MTVLNDRTRVLRVTLPPTVISSYASHELLQFDRSTVINASRVDYEDYVITGASLREDYADKLSCRSADSFVRKITNVTPTLRNILCLYSSMCYVYYYT